MNISFPQEFNNVLISALKSENSSETDAKICSIVLEMNLLSIFTEWVLHNTEWGNKHLMLIDALTMLSLSKKIIKNISFIETVVSCVWNYDLTKIQLLEELKNSKIKSILCLVLYRYLESDCSKDFNVIQSTFEIFSRDEKEAFVCLKNRGGKNILHIAAWRNKKVFNLFRKAVPKNNRQLILDERDRSKKNVLEYAVLNDSKPGIIKKIIKSYAKPERIKRVQSLLIKKGFCNFLGLERKKVLKNIIASCPKKDRIKILKIEDIERKTLWSSIVLNLSIFKELNSQFTGSAGQLRPRTIKLILKLLLESDREEAVTLSDKSGKNMLHHVAFLGNEEEVNVVFNAARDKFQFIQSADQNGRTPLHYAAISGNKIALKILLESLSTVESAALGTKADVYGKTPFYYALLNGNQGINIILLDALYRKNLSAEVEKALIEHPQDSLKILKGIKKLIPNQISHLLPQFKVKRENNEIHLLGKNSEFLQEKWALLREYAEQINTSLEISGCCIENVVNDEELNLGFTKFVSIHELLPKHVRTHLGLRSTEGNCHGAARLATGKSPSIIYVDRIDVSRDLEEIPLENLSIGDLVFLKMGPKGTQHEGERGAHSFIYLSDDFCLSMNGTGHKLKFYPTSDVLRHYGYPVDVLMTSKATEAFRQNIVLLRKSSYTAIT